VIVCLGTFDGPPPPVFSCPCAFQVQAVLPNRDPGWSSHACLGEGEAPVQVGFAQLNSLVPLRGRLTFDLLFVPYLDHSPASSGCFPLPAIISFLPHYCCFLRAASFQCMRLFFGPDFLFKLHSLKPGLTPPPYDQHVSVRRFFLTHFFPPPMSPGHSRFMLELPLSAPLFPTDVPFLHHDNSAQASPNRGRDASLCSPPRGFKALE